MDTVYIAEGSNAVSYTHLDVYKRQDILCIQETKMQEGQAEVPLEGYHQYWCSAEKKGYSGTAVFTKEEPVSVRCGIGIEEHDHEGRMITAEYERFYLVNVYVPNLSLIHIFQKSVNLLKCWH